MFHSAPWRYRMIPDFAEHNEKLMAEPAEFRITDQTTKVLWRFFQTFFRLAEQRILTKERTHGDRHARKRLRRIKDDNDGVLVIRLRRQSVAREHAEERDVDWSCRWVVGGHWRNQFYPSIGEHRQIWIAPYVKGPEEKDLRLHAGRAFEFTR
jgi:hypothetical protein